MQLGDESFDTVLDKGALDALMEPEVGTKLGSQYLSEAKRVLKPGGKFICLTLAESHVLALLFSSFRFGWKMTVHSISQKRSSLKTFMVVAEKEKSTVLHEIASSFDLLSLGRNDAQGSGMCEALESENQIRRDCNNGSDLLYSHEDLILGVKGDLAELTGGRRVKFTLGSNFSYRAVLLDAQKQTEPFVYHCGVFLVPKTRAHEWLFCSEEGQWQVVESSRAARLIMVYLDSSHNGVSMEDIQNDLSPMVTQLAPRNDDEAARIPYVHFLVSQAYFKCAYECFDRRRNQEEISNCVEHCSVPVVKSQQHFENEMAQFQERLNRSLVVCQDKFEAAKLQKIRPEAVNEMESCVHKAIEENLNTLPHIVQRMKTAFNIAN
ncbi:hypothetical protein DY000_02029898 [Brassica cretica]|uniref:Methyltransferase type 11 domain-containing protein n=1 Tax=Brassica cretica TaxID=69181 RepID=A0ABQ7DPS8_BRACR|nr:hypothetical protein DY000_02029898 [Brassica cretica]